jgi:hypothetical protein
MPGMNLLGLFTAPLPQARRFWIFTLITVGTAAVNQQTALIPAEPVPFLIWLLPLFGFAYLTSLPIALVIGIAFRMARLVFWVFRMTRNRYDVTMGSAALDYSFGPGLHLAFALMSFVAIAWRTSLAVNIPRLGIYIPADEVIWRLGWLGVGTLVVVGIFGGDYESNAERVELLELYSLDSITKARLYSARWAEEFDVPISVMREACHLLTRGWTLVSVSGHSDDRRVLLKRLSSRTVALKPPPEFAQLTD